MRSSVDFAFVATPTRTMWRAGLQRRRRRFHHDRERRVAGRRRERVLEVVDELLDAHRGGRRQRALFELAARDRVRRGVDIGGERRQAILRRVGPRVLAVVACTSRPSNHRWRQARERSAVHHGGAAEHAGGARPLERLLPHPCTDPRRDRWISCAIAPSSSSPSSGLSCFLGRWRIVEVCRKFDFIDMSSRETKSTTRLTIRFLAAERDERREQHRRQFAHVDPTPRRANAFRKSA